MSKLLKYHRISRINLDFQAMASSAAQIWCLNVQDLNFVSKNRFKNFSPALKSLTNGHCLKQSQNVAIVRRELMVNSDVERYPYKALIMVYALQRLGIDYHFKDDIEQVLERQYMAISPHFIKNKDLRFASLCFRLLRQQHYCVPTDAFDNFMNKERKLEKRVIRGESTESLMSFYEASKLRIKGEDVLDEAEIFSCQLLKERIKFLNHHEARTISNTIAHPHHRSLARFTKNHFIKDVRARCGTALQELANSESAFKQAMHRRELMSCLVGMIGMKWNGMRFKV